MFSNYGNMVNNIIYEGIKVHLKSKVVMRITEVKYIGFLVNVLMMIYVFVTRSEIIIEG